MSFNRDQPKGSYGPLHLIVPLFIVTLIALPILNIHGSDVTSSSSERYDPFKVSCWTFPWDKDSFSSLKRWGSVLDEVSPYWYWSFENGSVLRTHEDAENVEYVTYCRQNGIGIIPMVSNNHDPDVVTTICRDQLVQERHISELLNITLKFNFDGLDINYESIRTEDRDVYSNFISNLSLRFGSKGRILSVSVFPKVADREYREGPDAYDYLKLGQSADQVRVMAYNLHWSSSPISGPIHSYDWVDTVLTYTSTVIPSKKVVLGVPQFSYDWKVKKDGRTLSVAENRSYGDIQSIIKEYNALRQWDHVARTPYLEYKGKDGYLHALHYTDMESLYHELKLLNKHSLGGIAVWKVGGEDLRTPDMVRSMKERSLSDLPPYLDIGGDLIGTVSEPIELGPVRAYDIEGRLTSIVWDLGDGNFTEELEPVHSYSSGGFYRAELAIKDELGNTVKMAKTVRIGPFAQFSTEGNREVGMELVFNGTTSWDADRLVSYSWDFGDGSYLFHDRSKVIHTYDRPGDFKVKLTVINSKGYVDVCTHMVVMSDREAPFANAGTDIMIWEDQTFNLDGSASWDGSGLLNHTWTLSNGMVLYGPKPSLRINDPGSYAVLLTVKDRSGNSASDLIQLTVRDRTPPVAIVTYTSAAIIGQTILLDATSSYDNVGIVRWIWDLGGGVTVNDRQSVSLKMTEAKRYYVTLEVLDAEMNWNSTTISIDSMDLGPPKAVLMIVPTPFQLNKTYLKESPYLLSIQSDPGFLGAILRNETYILSLETGDEETGIASITWHFGDSTTAGGPLVYHSYFRSGLYRGSVTVKDLFNNSIELDFSLLVVPDTSFKIIEFRKENIAYKNETTHIVDDVEKSPLLERWTIISLLGSSFVVIFITLDIAHIIVNRKGRKQERKEVNVK